MGLKKCPKCELNYIKEEEKFCHVCRGAKVVRSEETQAMCSECGENPAFKNTGLCLECLKEQRRREWLENMASGSVAEQTLLDSVCGLQDISVPLEEKDLETLQEDGEEFELEEEVPVP